MTVLGVGVDVVDVERFAGALVRTPGLRPRLFGETETSDRDLDKNSLAARFAVKEATLKALGGNIEDFSWHDIRLDGAKGQQPRLVLTGGVAARAQRNGVDTTHVSLSHDGGMAIAFVVLESKGA
jgi:holo-[acyl-carrier protein] synthase